MKRARAARGPVSPRAVAARLVEAVTARGRTLENARDADSDFAALPGRDRAFATKLAAVTLRHLGRLDAVIARFLDTAPKGAAGRAAMTALRLGAAQLLILNTPAHAALSESLRLLEGGPAARLKGLINAIMRRVDGAEGRAVFAALDPLGDLPDWLAAGWRGAYGADTARRIVEAQSAEPPLDLSCVTDAEGWARRLDATLSPTGTLRLDARGPVADLPGFADGAWWVQDAAARLPALVLDPPAGARAIDLCAAPGGKTAQLAARGAVVTALDRSAKRLSRLRDNLARLRLDAELVTADAARWRPADPAPFVLLDAPCSATGTLRKNPDLVHLKRARDIPAMAAAQALLLDAAGEMTAPGGRLVHAVCSLEPEEGPDQVHDFLARAPGFRIDPIAPGEVPGFEEALTGEGFVRTLPFHGPPGGCDGFFIARLKRLSG